jgi:S-phase kinase-associated protein 1
MSTKKIQTSDMNEDEYLEVDEAVIRQSQLVANLIDDISDNDEIIPLMNVSRFILEKIIEYCTEHVYDIQVDEEERQVAISDFDEQFLDTDQSTLFELILAANFLDIKSLLDLACRKVAYMIKGKTPEQIRQTFNIKNDFTPEEEDKLFRENEWCEQNK